MNRALFIILIPALLVAAGYVIVLREMGFSPGYPRLIVVVALILGALEIYLAFFSAEYSPTVKQLFRAK